MSLVVEQGMDGKEVSSLSRRLSYSLFDWFMCTVSMHAAIHVDRLVHLLYYYPAVFGQAYLLMNEKRFVPPTSIRHC